MWSWDERHLMIRIYIIHPEPPSFTALWDMVWMHASMHFWGKVIIALVEPECVRKWELALRGCPDDSCNDGTHHIFFYPFLCCVAMCFGFLWNYIKKHWQVMRIQWGWLIKEIQHRCTASQELMITAQWQLSGDISAEMITLWRHFSGNDKSLETFQHKLPLCEEISAAEMTNQWRHFSGNGHYEVRIQRKWPVWGDIFGGNDH